MCCVSLNFAQIIFIDKKKKKREKNGKKERSTESLPPDIIKLSVVSEYCQSVLVLKTAKITLVDWAICRVRKRGERKKKKWKMGNQE